MSGAETALVAMYLEQSGWRFEYDRAKKGWTCWNTGNGTVYGPFETVQDAVEAVLQRYDDGLEE